MPNQRPTLLVALATLALIQLVHVLDVLRYAEDATFPSVLADPLAITGIAAATVAYVAVARRWRHAHGIAVGAGGTVAVGFTLYHGMGEPEAQAQMTKVTTFSPLPKSRS